MPTILVVDDQDVNRRLLLTVLGHAGHKVLEASDGAEALGVVKAHRPALVISDIVMPTMDGYEFVRRLRCDPSIADTPVMFYTANYFDREARRLAASCGVQHVLTKPCEPETILSMVRTALQGSATAPRMSEDPSVFDHEHLRLMTDMLSAKVQELAATSERLAALVAIPQQLNRQRDVPSLLKHFSGAGRKVIAARHAIVALLDDSGTRLARVVTSGTDARADAESVDIEVAASVLGRPIVEARAVRLASVSIPFGEPPGPSDVRAFLGVPITSADETYGSICFAGKIGDEVFSDKDEQVALSLASLLAVAYENVKRLEAIQRQNEDLERRVDRRTAELKRSNEELEQFAYVASHDLQEPLRMVSSYTQLLGKRYKGRLDADADEFIAYAVDGATRMQALISDLLAFSRVNRSDVVSISADGALDEALARLTAAIRESGAVITRMPLPTVHADRGQLVQLFQNLIGNAIKFSGDRVAAVDVTASQTGGDWLFAVKDNGIGIDPRYAERIFGIFQRLHNRAAYPGTGIGLAICHRIVTRMGGRIWVDSRPGDGATFRFTIAAGDSQEAA
jgi:signal transduction histidine kinase